jgi:hypothetical protein
MALKLPMRGNNLQERGQQGDLQRPLGAVLFEVLHRGFEFVQPAAHAREQLLPFRRELDAAPGPLEELHLEVVLQRFDLLADRRRGHVQGLCGIGEGQARTHRLEDSQRIERQAGIGGGHVRFPYARIR